MITISTCRDWSKPYLLEAAVLAAVIVALLPQSTSAENMPEAETIIARTASTWQNFMQDPDLSGFRAHVKEAKGVLIVPALLKGAFMFGVEGGNGVLLVRDEKTGIWSEPAFYELSSVSWTAGRSGKLRGHPDHQTVKGIDSLLSSTIKLGADMSAATSGK